MHPYVGIHILEDKERGNPFFMIFYTFVNHCRKVLIPIRVISLAHDSTLAFNHKVVKG